MHRWALHVSRLVLSLGQIDNSQAADQLHIGSSSQTVNYRVLFLSISGTYCVGTALSTWGANTTASHIRCATMIVFGFKYLQNFKNHHDPLDQPERQLAPSCDKCVIEFKSFTFCSNLHQFSDSDFDTCSSALKTLIQSDLSSGTRVNDIIIDTAQFKLQHFIRLKV